MMNPEDEPIDFLFAEPQSLEAFADFGDDGIGLQNS
jgi:hypothetical protein